MSYGLYTSPLPPVMQVGIIPPSSSQSSSSSTTLKTKNIKSLITDNNTSIETTSDNTSTKKITHKNSKVQNKLSLFEQIKQLFSSKTNIHTSPRNYKTPSVSRSSSIEFSESLLGSESSGSVTSVVSPTAFIPIIQTNEEKINYINQCKIINDNSYLNRFFQDNYFSNRKYIVYYDPILKERMIKEIKYSDSKNHSEIYYKKDKSLGEGKFAEVEQWKEIKELTTYTDEQKAFSKQESQKILALRTMITDFQQERLSIDEIHEMVMNRLQRCLEVPYLLNSGPIKNKNIQKMPYGAIYDCEDKNIITTTTIHKVATEGNLFNKINLKHQLHERNFTFILNVITQLSNALKFIHEKDVALIDVKPENVLISIDKESNTFVYQHTDLGNSMNLNNSDEYKQEGIVNSPMYICSQDQITFIHTRNKAHEAHIKKNKKEEEKSEKDLQTILKAMDIYAHGVMFFSAILLKEKFMEITDLKKTASDKIIPIYNINYSKLKKSIDDDYRYYNENEKKKLQKIVEKLFQMIDQDYKNRPKANDIHNFISTLNIEINKTPKA